MRIFVVIFGLLALGATSVVVAQARDCVEDGCVEGGCAEDGCAQEARAQQARAEPEGREHGAADEDDACGEQPCPCDGDDSDCPPNCHDCACFGIGASTVAPSVTTSIGCAPPALLLAEPPLERQASGVTSRVFRPPRA